LFGDVKILRKFEGYIPARQFSTGTPVLRCGKLYTVLLLLSSYGSSTTAASYY